MFHVLKPKLAFHQNILNTIELKEIKIELQSVIQHKADIFESQRNKYLSVNSIYILSNPCRLQDHE